MVQKFSTNFMPKAPQAGASNGIAMPPRNASAGGAVRMRQTVNIFSVLAVLLVFVAGVASGGVFLFERTQIQRVDQMTNQLQTAEKQFEPELIQELQDLDKRLGFSSQLVRSHTTLAPFFNFINENTLPEIQFDSFAFEFSDDGIAVVQVAGQGQSYQAIAQQSGRFADSRYINEHIFSDFSLQDSGRVRFGLVITLGSELLNFEESSASTYSPYPEAQPVVLDPVSTGNGLGSEAPFDLSNFQ